MALGYLLGAAFQAEDSNGKPLTGGTVRVCLHNTTEPYITYKDFEGDRNPEYIPLDESGMAVIIASDSHVYDVYCKNRFGGDEWSRLNVTVGGSGGGGGGGDYYAGNGINIESSIISVDGDVVAMKNSLADVAFSGSYSDLSNTPSIPDPLPSMTGNAGKFLAVNSSATAAEWKENPASLYIAQYNVSTFQQVKHAIAANNTVFLKIASYDDSPLAPIYYNGAADIRWVYQEVSDLNAHSYSQQCNKAWVYTLKANDTWSYATYDITSKIVAGTGLGYSYNNNTLTLNVDAPLPAYNSTMAGDLLAVKSDGSGVEWVDNQVPAYTSSDQYKVLSVAYNGNGTQWRDVREVPSYAVVNQGYLLGVVNNGGHVELGWTQPRGYFTQGVDCSGNHEITADDITAGYYDLEFDVSVSDPTSAMYDSPTYLALSWDCQYQAGATSSAVSSIEFYLGINGDSGSYEKMFADTAPAHEVHKDWGITRGWVLNYRKNRLRVRINLSSGATAGYNIYFNGGGILTQVR